MCADIYNFILFLFSTEKSIVNDREIEVWITMGDKTSLFSKSADLTFGDSANASVPVIDSTQKFQSIDGFGYALTGGSANH
jgi:glucosylceramidase